MTDHKPLPVAGYTTQSDDKIARANALKFAEERYLRILDEMSKDAPALIDPRCVARARTLMQEANMWGVRAIFQPTRIKLPEDAP